VPHLPLSAQDVSLLRAGVPVDTRPHVVAARLKHRRAYTRWSNAEDALLRRLFMDGYPTSAIAHGLERNPSGVDSRLKKLGLVVVKPPKPPKPGAPSKPPRAKQPQGQPAAPRVILQAPSTPCVYCAAPVPAQASSCPNCGAGVGTVQTAAHPHVPRLPLGTKLCGGRYTLGKILGTGGFGITYMGADTHTQVRVAIKEFFPSGATRQDRLILPPHGMDAHAFAAERMKHLEEAQRLKKFRHSSIVAVHDAFEEHGTAYLVMEHLSGETLEARVHRSGALAAGEVANFATQLLVGLAQVHAAGLLHRDIKPDNVMLCEGARAVLIDFGAAREFQTAHTQRHSLILTPGYAPLEQYGSHVKRSASSDLYALSGTLYFALTGRVPPPATERINGATLDALPVAVTRAAPGLSDAITAALSIRIEERPQSALEMIERIHAGRKPKPSSAALQANWFQRLMRLLALG
jgi:serine/threonine-protein kinase